MSTIPFEKSFASHPKSQYWSEKNIDENGNKIDTKNVLKGSNEKYWFNCDCGHDFDCSLSNILLGRWCPYCSKPPKKLCNNQECKKCFEKSFANYEDKDKLACWSNQNKNKDGDIITPRDVFKSSGKLYFFNCNSCSHLFDIKLDSLRQKKWCRYCVSQDLCNKECEICYKKSFASHEKSKYWSDKNVDKNGNKINTRNIVKGSNEKYWFNCDCGHKFEKILKDVSEGGWCPYCCVLSQKLCHDKDCKNCLERSFANYEDKDKLSCWSNQNKNKDGDIITPRDVFKNDNDKYLFNCYCGHLIEKTLSSIVRGEWCCYCSNPPKQLCNKEDCESCFKKSFASHEKSQYWSDKNELKPRNVFKNSNDKYWFNCKKDHEFEKRLGNIVSQNCWCPYCKNKTEQKLFEILQVDFPDLKHQFKEDWCKNPLTNKHLPFDFVLEKEKIIIELDGRQHFEQVSNWSTPEEQYERDTYKMECANQNGYSIIRITQEDVLNDTFDWYKMLKESIETIIQKESIENHFISYEEDYTHFN